jgi:hypothetical protein
MYVDTLPKVKLDELEMMINLLKLEDTSVTNMKYKELALKISIVFNVNVNEHDVFLLYEPSLQNDIVDSQIHYSSILDYSPYLDKVN